MEAKIGRKGIAPIVMIPAIKVSSRAAIAGVGGLAPRLGGKNRRAESAGLDGRDRSGPAPVTDRAGRVVSVL